MVLMSKPPPPRFSASNLFMACSQDRVGGVGVQGMICNSGRIPCKTPSDSSPRAQQPTSLVPTSPPRTRLRTQGQAGPPAGGEGAMDSEASLMGAVQWGGGRQTPLSSAGRLVSCDQKPGTPVAHSPLPHPSHSPRTGSPTPRTCAASPPRHPHAGALGTRTSAGSADGGGVRAGGWWRHGCQRGCSQAGAWEPTGVGMAVESK